MFAVGRKAGLSLDQNREIILAEESNSDILFGDFNEHLENLTFKDSMLFTWAKRNCPSLEYFFKGDDDIFLNPFALTELIQNSTGSFPRIYGEVKRNNKPRRMVRYFTFL